jgi:DNA-binding Lrp family transcriptional regulator
MEIIKRKDMLLMTHLRRNARENLTRISKLTHIPVSTVFDRLREFEKGLIQKHTTLLDFRRLGFDIRVNMLFKVSKDMRDSLRDFLMSNENVNSLFKVNNGYDYLVEAVFRDMNDLQRFTDLLDKFRIESRQELFVLEDLKREGFMSDEVHTRLLLQTC